MTPVIEAAHVSKTFYVSLLRERSLRQEAARLLTGLFKSAPQPTLHAVNDVSFSIAPGECVALVGRNGAGKSTLLRLLAGIFQPTRGTLTVRGRHAALIGLGTGFIPELTGRQNITLSAAIHGLRKHEIEQRRDEIIDFAELGDFIDVSVNLYSSGMAARLGFSIIIHCLPEIIFIDEILSVGDGAFQTKSFARLRQMRDEGRTLVMVAHDLTRLQGLCSRALWLEEGHLRADGDADTILTAYGDDLHTYEGGSQQPVRHLTYE